MLSNESVLFESEKSGGRRPKRLGSEELKPILEKPLSVVRNHPGCPTLIGPIFCYAHLMSKGLEAIRRKTLVHSIYDIIGCRYLLEADFPWNDVVPNKVISNIDMLGGVHPYIHTCANNSQIWSGMHTYIHTYIICIHAYMYLHLNITSINMYIHTLHPFIHAYWLNMNIYTNIYYHM